MNGLPFVFANPWGALALLGLPAVIAIHCLQQKSRTLRVSTLFLLDRLSPDSQQGSRFTWMRQSLAFWLQILCVLVLTWLLLEPHWLRADAVQRVVLVLDSSISMRAFTDDLVDRTSPRLRALAALTPRTYWTLLETDPSRPTLYEGLDLTALEEKLRAWRPSMAGHDPTHALELARSVAPRDALVIFVTDRPHEVPSGIDLLAIGEPIENCGLVGSRVLGTGPDLEWQVMVQNYGQKTAHRSWWIELAGQKTDPQTIDLDPGHSKILRGKFPPGLDRLEVCLDADRFTVDDRMAIVRPQLKRLTVSSQGDDSTADIFTRLMQTLPALDPAVSGQPTDVAFIGTSSQVPIPDNTHPAVVLFANTIVNNLFVGEPFSADEDPMNQDLSWQGLVMQPGDAVTLAPLDHVLLWKDRIPLIYFRSIAGNRRQLVFNFDFPTSNATKLPAFVLLIRRYLESIRTDKMVPEIRNAELNEPLLLAADPTGGPVVRHDPDGTETTFSPRARVTLNAPSLPGFFSVTQGGQTLLSGAAQFADARESDFRTAVTVDTLTDHRARLMQLRTSSEALTPLWLLLIGVSLVSYWAATNPRLK